MTNKYTIRFHIAVNIRSFLCTKILFNTSCIIWSFQHFFFQRNVLENSKYVFTRNEKKNIEQFNSLTLQELGRF